MNSLYSLLCRKSLQSFFNKAFVCKTKYKYSDLYQEYSELWYKYIGKKEGLDFESTLNNSKIISHTKKITNTLSNLRNLIESDVFNHLSIVTSFYYWDEKISGIDIEGHIEALFIDNRNGDLVIFKTKDYLLEDNLLLDIINFDLVPGIVLKSSGIKKNIITYFYDPIYGKLDIVNINLKRLKNNYEYITSLVKSLDSRFTFPFMEKNKCKSCLCRKQCEFSLAKNIEGIPITKINHQFIEDFLF